MSGEEQYRALQRRARRDGRATDELLTLYALEGFLRRLVESKYADSFVLKGGMLLAALDTRRPTRDIDVQAMDLPVDETSLLEVTAEVLAVAMDDGLTYEAAKLTATTIRDGDDYTGVRLAVPARLHTGELKLKLDVSTGDPIHPQPTTVELPTLLKDGVLLMRGFPLTMVIAEKAVTAVQRGTANTRWRDFGDIHLLARRHRIDGQELHASLQAVAEHRRADLRPLVEVLDGYAAAEQSRWAAWRRKQDLDELLPAQFSDALTTVTQLVDPILLSNVERGVTWRPGYQRWE